jgi:hypothetical protein
MFHFTESMYTVASYHAKQASDTAASFDTTYIASVETMVLICQYITHWSIMF